MNQIRKLFVKYDARNHAEVGVDVGQERVLATLGNRPVLDPTGNAVHAGYVSRMNNLGTLEDHREEVTTLERRAIDHPSPIGLTCLLVFLFVAECVGGVLLMQTLGYEGFERLVLGTMMAAFVYFCTWLAARTATAEAATPRQGAWFFGSLAVYAIVLVSVAGVRVRDAMTEGGSPFWDLCMGIVLLVTSIGPAAVSEVVMRRREPAVRVQRELSIARRHLREAQRDHDQAERAVGRITRATTDYDNDATQQAALYSIEQRVTRARRGKASAGEGGAPTETT